MCVNLKHEHNFLVKLAVPTLFIWAFGEVGKKYDISEWVRERVH